MAVPKARSAGRVLLVAGAAGVVFVVWLFAVWPPPIWWRDHEPRCTAMMRLRADVQSCRREGGASARRHENAPLLQRMVIIAEDSRFKTHHGIDFIELRDAWAAGGHRGASTITQQLAKNLYLSPSRSIFRKLKEAVTAVRLELALSKDRIMELYLTTAEFGPGVWGADAASRAYFGVATPNLTSAQAAALAATLPWPRTSNPAYRPGRMLERRELILARYYGGKAPVPPVLEDSIPTIPPIEPPIVPIIPIVPIDTGITPDTTRDHPDSGGPVDSTQILAVRLLPSSAGPRVSVYKP
jgi:monofunctional glycosyltransferase